MSEEVTKKDVALYELGEAAEQLSIYLSSISAEEADRSYIAGLVHELNARYISYAHLVDMAEVAVVD